MTLWCLAAGDISFDTPGVRQDRRQFRAAFPPVNVASTTTPTRARKARDTADSTEAYHLILRQFIISSPIVCLEKLSLTFSKAMFTEKAAEAWAVNRRQFCFTREGESESMRRCGRLASDLPFMLGRLMSG